MIATADNRSRALAGAAFRSCEKSCPAGAAARRRGRALRFNMVEVVLGLGLISFGLVSTMGLFPIGLQATRNSVAENYAAETADQFLHYLAARLKNPTDSFGNWEQFGQTLPTEKPSETEPSQTWEEWFNEDTTTFWYAGSYNQYYKIEQSAVGAEKPDFTAICRVWRGGVTYSRYTDGEWVEATASDDYALSINIEISWPQQLPYDRRQKALYNLEVYKPPQ